MRRPKKSEKKATGRRNPLLFPRLEYLALEGGMLYFILFTVRYEAYPTPVRTDYEKMTEKSCNSKRFTATDTDAAQPVRRKNIATFNT